MSKIYAMRRANGDWFALKSQGRSQLPLFHSSHDAMMARLRNFGMLLFKPVALDARLLGEIVPVGAGSDIDFCMVSDPFASLSCGSQVAYAQLALLISNCDEHRPVSRNGSGFPKSVLNKLPQSEWWN